jgi:hypothetical protein
MIDIILTDDQYRQLSTAEGLVRVRNPRGVEIGTFTPGGADAAPLSITADEVVEIDRRMRRANTRQFTTAEVLERLKSRAEACDQ